MFYFMSVDRFSDPGLMCGSKSGPESSVADWRHSLVNISLKSYKLNIITSDVKCQR